MTAIFCALLGFVTGVAVGFVPMAFFVAGLADKSDVEGPLL